MIKGVRRATDKRQLYAQPKSLSKGVLEHPDVILYVVFVLFVRLEASPSKSSQEVGADSHASNFAEWRLPNRPVRTQRLDVEQGQ